MGADMVLHSATKYLGGHSDLVLGTVIAANQELADRLHFVQNASGAVPGPMDCFLVLRGIKTLHLRVQRACDNAMRIATFLEPHPKVGLVRYPGLTSHPQHELATRQMRGFGAMVSFDLKDDSMENAWKVLTGTHLFSLAESLGGVESLIGHPASMTHASIPREDRLRNGLTDSLIRLSVGVEDIEDLMTDLRDALDKI
jgi:cystathionine beta-lyase